MHRRGVKAVGADGAAVLMEVTKVMACAAAGMLCHSRKRKEARLLHLCPNLSLGLSPNQG
jgi:hypothetical protein